MSELISPHFLLGWTQTTSDRLPTKISGYPLFDALTDERLGQR